MYRTKEERQNEIRVIIDKLNELNLTIIHEPIRKLFNDHFIPYIHDNKQQFINIPFYEIDKLIQGTLEINKSKRCVLKLSKID